MFRGKMAPPSSVLKGKLSKKPPQSRQQAEQISACCLLHAGFLLGLLLNPEDGTDMFLRNVSQC
jgi:hypothetical protein